MSIKRIKKTLSRIFYLWQTRAPANVFISYIVGLIKNQYFTKSYLESQRTFRKRKSSLRLSNDWFTKNIPFWLSAFDKYNLASKDQAKALEIGSWEGLSGYFILHSLPNVTLTCVDTWEGADEHKASHASTKEVLSNTETAFEYNLSIFKERLIKYKGTSFSFFNDHSARNVFDLIYVDGSHYCDDVVIDAIRCFGMLKVGGIMIFDDYFWKYYPKAIDNPAAAINLFLRLKKGSYRIVHMYYQIIIEKTSDNS